MQDVTDLAFMRLMMEFGGPDLFFTEYFRVTPGFRPNREILRSITENDTGRPVIAQLIGNDPLQLADAARQLIRFPTHGIDLNLGCPAPVVYRKCAGGGLLRDPARVERLITALRDAVPGVLTVKTRVGFEVAAEFPRLIDTFSRQPIDLLTIHGRTVSERYRPWVHTRPIAEAVAKMVCPVLANGGVDSVQSAFALLAATGAHGLMIGRGAIRNPWVFQQIRDAAAQRPVFQPVGHDLLAYIHRLFEATTTPGVPEPAQVHKMKKYLNFIGAGLSPPFLHDIRRTATRRDFFFVCRRELEHDAPLDLHVPAPFTDSSPTPSSLVNTEENL